MGRIFNTNKRPVVEKIKRRWKQAELEKLSYEDIAKMGLNELVNVTSALQSLVKRRKSAIHIPGGRK